jgi:hypothetical protein
MVAAAIGRSRLLAGGSPERRTQNARKMDARFHVGRARRQMISYTCVATASGPPEAVLAPGETRVGKGSWVGRSAQSAAPRRMRWSLSPGVCISDERSHECNPRLVRRRHGSAGSEAWDLATTTPVTPQQRE